MLLPDVNVLIYAHREDAPEHGRYAAWLTSLTEASEPFALSEIVLASFLRIVTNPRIFDPPTPISPRWRSSTAASWSPPTATSRAFRGCDGGTRSPCHERRGCTGSLGVC